jgi:hypothetical protein
MSSSLKTSEHEPNNSAADMPHVSRVLDYLLGGTANTEADRQVAEFAFTSWPGEVGGVDGARLDIRSARQALQRIVTFLVSEAGVHQFLDIASGLPTMGNVHLTAQSLEPAAKVVYVDNDPLVVDYSRELLVDSGAILAEAGTKLDFTRPVGLILFGILHFIDDDATAHQLARQLYDALCPGSYVAVSHFARTEGDVGMDETFEQLNKQWGESITRRTRSQVESLLEPFQLVTPGIVELPDWRPPAPHSGPRPLPMWCGLAVKV